MPADFSAITERSGDPATPGQIADMFHRYRWASGFCSDRRVIELACGTGQGLGLLQQVARSVVGCDIDEGSIAAARAAYGERVELHATSAAHIPCGDGEVDVLLMSEALYLLPDVDAFLCECRRALTPSGILLITTTNKDVFDFVPSLLSHRYYGAGELAPLLSRHGFACRLFGYARGTELPLRHRALRPVKAVARRLGLVPKTMVGKAFLRRLVFGKLPAMPRDISVVDLPYTPPTPIPMGGPDREHRFLYLVGKLEG